MLERVLRDAAACKRYRCTRLGAGLDAFADHLLNRGHPRKVAAGYLRLALHFAHWVERKRLQSSTLAERDVERFVAHAANHGRCSCPPPRATDVQGAKGVLRQLLVALRASGAIPAQCASPPAGLGPSEDAVRTFSVHLEHHQALRPSVRRAYSREALMLLHRCFGSRGRLAWERVTPARVAHFVAWRARGRKPRTAHAVGTAVRSFLRYAALSGWVDASLARAVPHAAVWTLADVPRTITTQQLVRLMASFDRRTAIGRRDAAMALLMAQLGLRRAEVAELMLDDLEWRTGVLRLSRTKARREQAVPLPPDVGRALVAYLQRGRPESPCRQVFLTHRTPKGQPLTPAGAGSAIRYGFERAGLSVPDVPSLGTHVLRHTAATRMLAHGATLKEIADVLRHRSISTTARYAKVDVERLRTVALPWPDSATLA